MRALGWLFALALLSSATTAAAYCRSSVCRHGSCETDDDCAPHETCSNESCAYEGQICVPAQTGDCGIPLAWAQPCVGFSVQKDASAQISLEDADHVLAASLAAWTGTSCGAAPPSIAVSDLGRVSCDAAEYNEHAGNANVLLFRDDAWPYGIDEAPDVIALTTVTYDTETGAIYDADIEVNSANFHFTTTDATPPGDDDLQSVLTHESGHFFGLAHSAAPGATMVSMYPGGTSLRSLSDDDIAGLCAAYPPGRKADGKCDAIPRHGFADACGSAQTETNCSASPGVRGATGSFGFCAIAALAAFARRRAWLRSPARACRSSRAGS